MRRAAGWVILIGVCALLFGATVVCEGWIGAAATWVVAAVVSGALILAMEWIA